MLPAQGQDYVVRMGYVIPSDRSPQPGAVEELRESMAAIQDWYEENMLRQGFGAKTFRIETEADGVTPRVHVIYDNAVTAYYLSAEDVPLSQRATTIIERLRESMVRMGYGNIGWQNNENWLVMGESHVQLPDSTTTGAVWRGGTGGRDHGGEAYLSSTIMFRFNLDLLTDTRPYDGEFEPRVGPYPMIWDVTFDYSQGDTFSYLSSTALYGIGHEMGHAFCLPHQPLNNCNMMGGGRGVRGAILPELFPQDDSRLAYGSALLLNSSRYFNHGQTWTDNSKPSVTIDTPNGTIVPVNGHLEISFTASDYESGLAAAFLRCGDEWGSMPLSGTYAETSFQTPYYEPGVARTYQVVVMDQQGNKQATMVTVTPESGHNRAPIPRVELANSRLKVGVPFTINVFEQWGFGYESDWSGTTVEWDMDGDGSYDTLPATNKSLSWTYDQTGIFQIKARLIDPQGATAVSLPIGVRVTEDPPASPVDVHGEYKSSGHIVITWRNGDVGTPSAYDIYRDGQFEARTGSLYYTDSGLEPWTRYCYRVLAHMDSGADSEPSEEVCIVTNDQTLLSVSEAAVTSSAYDIGNPSSCFDGNENTIMRSTSTVNPAWVQVSFPDVRVVTKLSAMLGQPGYPDIDKNIWWVEAADTQSDLDGQTGSYIMALPSDVYTLDGDWDRVLLSQPVSRRIWKFNLQRTVPAGGSGYVHVRELELWTESSAVAPSTPENFEITEVLDDTISMQWDDTSMNESSFRMERRADFEPSFETVGMTAADMTSWQDSGLLPATVYYYRVIACNGYGDSAASEEDYATITPPPPPKPTGLVAISYYNEARLFWTPDTQTDPPVLYYKIFRSTVQNGPYRTAAVAFGGSRIFDHSVINDTTYYYRITAVDTWGHESELSDEVNATPYQLYPPPAPELFASVMTWSEGGSINVFMYWNYGGSGSDTMEVERKVGRRRVISKVVVRPRRAGIPMIAI